MKHGFKKPFVYFLLIMMVLSTENFSFVNAGENSSENEKQEDTVTVTVEKSTLGQGYYLEPTQVKINSGDSVKSVLNKVIEENAVWKGNDLAAIIGAQSGTLSIPEEISSMGCNENLESAPTTDSALTTGLKSSDRLAEKDYSSMSAWMCSVNQELRGSSFGDVSINSGDVIRIQFSVWGNGADLGRSLSDKIAANDVADKEALTKLLGTVKSSPYYEHYLAEADFCSKYNEALLIAQAIDSTQTAVDCVCHELQEMIPVIAKSIAFDNSDYEINVSQTQTMTLKTKPLIEAAGISWESSDPVVAVVDENGIVTGISPGTAVITAATKDGLSANSTVTVSAIPTTEPQLGTDQSLTKIDGSPVPNLSSSSENTTDLKELDSITLNKNGLMMSSMGMGIYKSINLAVVTAKTDISAAYHETAAYMLVAAAQPTIASGLWEIICFARSGYGVPAGYYDSYYNSVVAEVQVGNGTISGDRTNTDYSKTIMSLTALGKNPTNVGGYNLLTKLADFDKIKRGGMMAYVWALLALDSNDYEIPVTDTGTQTTRDLLIKTILDREVVTSSGVRGGFSLYSDSADASPDTDVTAMTLQSLAKYKDREDVKPVIERALTVLSGLQNQNGSYGTFGAPETAESTSQVILALTSLGIDPGTDDRFIKGGSTTLNDLMTYYVTGGGFMHIKAGGSSNGGAEPGTVNGMASYQASQAIVSYNRFKSGKTWIFRMTDGFSAVTDNNTNMSDLIDKYNDRFGKSGTSTATIDNTSGEMTAATGSSAGGTTAGESTGNTTAVAVSSKGGGTAAEDTAFTPWTFDGTYTAAPKTESSAAVATDGEKDRIFQDNIFLLSAGGAGIAAVAGISALITKKKKTIR